MSQQIKHLLIELDCLLDTRLATVHRLNPNAAYTLFNNPDYYTREWDDWETLTKGAITLEQFNDAYATRDVETLKLAKPTGIVKLLKEITTLLDQQRCYMPDVDGTEVIVNIAPYRLSSSEKHTLETIVYSYCHFLTTTKTINQPIETITPLAMKQQWDAVFLYDFNQWFEHHGESLSTTLIPRNQLITARRYRCSPEALRREYEQEVNEQLAFDLLQFACTERLELIMLGLNEFSILRHTGGSL